MDKVTYSPVYTSLEPQKDVPTQYFDDQVNMKDLYTQEELDKIISRFDCLHSSSPNGTKCKFDMVYIPLGNCIIIDNKNMTNDTVEIYRNGRAVSVGSWHQKYLDGDYSDIIADVQSRNEAVKQKGEAKLTSELDSMATLGKSQINK